MTAFIRLHKNIILEITLLTAAALSIIVGGLNIYMLIFSVAMHELGHIIAALIKGVKVKNFAVHGFGVEITFPGRTLNPKKMFYISAGGPAMTLILATLGYYINNYLFFAINISILIINLLPVYPLDGGNMLSYVLSHYCQRKKVKIIMRVLGYIFGFFISFCGICFLFVSNFNISLIYMGLFIIFSSNRPQNSVVEIFNNEYSKIEKSSVYIIDDTLSSLEIADNLPINSIGAIKNKEGRITSFVTPLFLYNLEINKKESRP